MCCVSLLLAIGIFSKNHNIILRIAMGCLVVLDVMYITFSDSRACRIALTVGVAVCAVLYTVKSRRRGVTVLLAVVAVVASVALPTAIKTVYNNSVAVMEKKETVSASSSAKPSSAAKPSAEPDATKVTIRPKETNAADISNRRIDIWKSAIEIFKEKPVFGVGHNTVLAYVEAEQEDSYLINNDHMHFSSMHNAFFDILVAQGAVGLLLYLALAVWCIIAVFKNWKQISMQLQGIAPAYLAVLAAMVCASCFMSEILYVCSPMSFMFWMALGALMQTVKRKRGNIMQKVLSISVAAYNVEKFIEQCLDSFVDPAILDRVEVLVTDDGSKDRTPEIVSAYEKISRNIPFDLTKNAGPGSTVNSGIKHATGNIFVW